MTRLAPSLNILRYGITPPYPLPPANRCPQDAPPWCRCHVCDPELHATVAAEAIQRRAAIAACGRCNLYGWLPDGTRCDHRSQS